MGKFRLGKTTAPCGTPEISVVVPLFNEGENLSELFARLRAVLGRLGLRYELIFVNDGSTDNSLEILKDLSRAATDHATKIIDLSRDFGQQIAITAGIDHARGEMIVIIDADLQDPPELIPKMVAKCLEGFDVVYGVRERRLGEGFINTSLARLFYRLLKRVANISIPVDAGDFRLINRKVARELIKMREQHRFIRGLVSAVGLKQVGIPYERDRRLAGQTKHPLKKRLALALDALVGFSYTPLRLIVYSGVAVIFLGLACLLLTIFSNLKGPATSDWLYLLSAVLIIGGAQLLSIGLIGEYVRRIFEMGQARSLYIVNEVYVVGDDLSDKDALHSKVTST